MTELGLSRSTTVFVPPVAPTAFLGDTQQVILDGIDEHPLVERSHDETDADFTIVGFRHLLDEGDGPSYRIISPDRTIIVDYRDQSHDLFADDALVYFKRSTLTGSGDLVAYDRAVEPISYCVRNVYRDRCDHFPAVRDIDVAAFFEHDAPGPNNLHRASVATTVRDRFAHRQVHVGTVGQRGPTGRNTFQSEYFETMTRSKIIVTCNPSRWEGDWRTFEALSSGALVLCDVMATPIPHPVMHREHLVYYDRDNMDGLVQEIERYLADDAERERIAQAGYEHAMRFHTPEHRIDQILRDAWAASTR